MNKQFWLAAVLFSLFGSLHAQPKTQPNNGSGSMGPSGQNGQMMMQADCTSLPPDQQNFANQLSQMNKMMFCSKFNNQQRAQAMQMGGQLDAYGNTMTNDQAVQKVAQDNNLSMPMQNSGQQKRAPRGCPVQ